MWRFPGSTCAKQRLEEGMPWVWKPKSFRNFPSYVEQGRFWRVIQVPVQEWRSAKFAVWDRGFWQFLQPFVALQTFVVHNLALEMLFKRVLGSRQKGFSVCIAARHSGTASQKGLFKASCLAAGKLRVYFTRGERAKKKTSQMVGHVGLVAERMICRHETSWPNTSY